MNAKRGHFFMWGTRVKLVSTHDQQEMEQDYYQNALGFSGSFLFADNLEEARVMVAANRGFLPVESVSGLSQMGTTICLRQLLLQLFFCGGAFLSVGCHQRATGTLICILVLLIENQRN